MLPTASIQAATKKSLAPTLRLPVKRNINVLNIKKIQITANKMQRFLIYLFLQTLYMFQTLPPPVIRSTTVHTASGIVNCHDRVK
jgi:hypothetical protein